MPTTQDFEYLLDRTNVIAVEYDDKTDTLDVWVSQKLPDDALATADNVAEPRNHPDWFDGDVTVHDAGYGEERDGFDPAGNTPALSDDGHPVPITAAPEAAGRQARVRPVRGGVSEAHHASTAGTSGVLAVVTDPDAAPATWSDDVAAGDLVRLSNHHVYCHPLNDCPVDGSQPVLQPGPYDGGGDDDAVGTVAGYVPLVDGAVVDAAARTVGTHDAPGVHDLPLAGTTVYRGEYAALKGETVTKAGRTTDVDSGVVQAVDATSHVGYGGETGVVKLRHQILTDAMSEGGDSGSPVVAGDAKSGALVGHLFAGSDAVSVVNRAATIETELGVTLMPNEIESLEESMDVQMESPDLSLVSAEPQGAPKAGEQVTLNVTLESNYRQRAYVEVHGPQGSSRAEIPVDNYDETDDGAFRASGKIAVGAPDAYTPTFNVVVRGGHVLPGE